MGACYTVEMKIKISEKKKATEALHNHMLSDKRTDYGLEEYAKIGIHADSLDHIIQIYLAGKNKSYTMDNEDGWSYYENDFDASYGWERVLYEMFEILAPFLEDESEMTVYPDNGCTHIIIHDRQCIYSK